MKRSTEDKLKELSETHTQLNETVQAQKGSTSKVLIKMWEEQLKTLELAIISTLKEGFGEGKKAKQPKAEHDDKKALVG